MCYVIILHITLFCEVLMCCHIALCFFIAAVICLCVDVWVGIHWKLIYRCSVNLPEACKHECLYWAQLSFAQAAASWESPDNIVRLNCTKSFCLQFQDIFWRLVPLWSDIDGAQSHRMGILQNVFIPYRKADEILSVYLLT